MLSGPTTALAMKYAKKNHMLISASFSKFSVYPQLWDVSIFSNTFR